MSITNMQGTENQFAVAHKVTFIKKYIMSLFASVESGKSNGFPITGRGRALYTTDYFLNGKPVLSNHDSVHVSLRNRFAA
jgi:hypothetical protein